MCLTASEVIAEVFEFIIKSDFAGLLSSLLKFRFKRIGTTLVAYIFYYIFYQYVIGHVLVTLKCKIVTVPTFLL